ncbi:phage tail tape measure protein [Streptomyces sp. NPDC093589]|uniref:phage tail tape measure protein n=1 Tax=Streptomyces sp. NPDC093589 TaxID=3366043 RepID=UPI0037FD6F65
MANWNLSVDLRGNGASLARTLKDAAKDARTMSAALARAKANLRELDGAARSARGNLRALGNEARTAARDITRLSTATRDAARNLNRYGAAARTAQHGMDQLGNNSRNASRQISRMTGQLSTAIRDLNRLGTAARTAAAHTGRVGTGGVASMRRFASETGRAHSQLRSMATLLSGGALVMGLGEMVKEGNAYQQQMNSFGAVTGATQMQMKRAAATATQLGNDLSLPGATAGDAAEAMVELAKAGFRTDQAISATGASLRLASAAQVNAADSAKYLGDIMDQFGLGADQASRAADTLASTANAASGDITDIYYAMKYAGPVAHGLGVSIDETASAVGMLGKAGILGQTAGTTLRGMFANLAAPTKQMTQGLEAMGIQAWDAQGNFKGLRYVIDGLSKAQHSMSQQDFAAAVKKSMGKPAMSGAIALAHQGVDSFDNLMAAVKNTGSAAEIAAAKGKGLAGAMVGLKTQAKQTGLALYDGMAPGLEFLTRGITKGLSSATPKITKFFNYLNDAAVLFGPDLASAAHDAFSGIADAAGDMLAPFKELGGDALSSFLHLLLTVGKAAIDVLTNIAHGVEPVISALGGVADGSNGAATALDIVVTAFDAAASVISVLSGVLGPIGHVVGGLVSAFGALPAPVQTAVAAMLLFRRVQGPLTGLANTVRGRVTGAFQSLGQQMAVQRNLAASAGQSISRYGAAFSVLQTRVPIIGQMAGSFRQASAAGTGFTSTLRGVASAAGTGLRGAMGGLMSAMGGPWGLALAGVTVGLGMLASSQQEAATKAAEHKASIDGLTNALRQSNGVIDESVRQQAAQTVQGKKLEGVNSSLMNVMGDAGYKLKDVTDAYLGQGTSVSKLSDHMRTLAKAQKAAFERTDRGDSNRDAIAKKAMAYEQAAKALDGMAGDSKKAASAAKELDAAQKGSGEGVSAYDRLKAAVGALADKTGDADSRTRALRASLDLLSGGSISLQAAQARVNEAITQANEAMSNGVSKTDGWGKSLVKANGQIDTTTKNGQGLFNTLNNIADGSADAAIAAYDFAESQGKDLPAKLAASRGEMQKARDAAIKLGEGYGLSTKQAQGVADAMGLIPGQVSILLQTKGVDSTLAELLAVQAEFAKVPKSKTVKVDTLSDDAKKKLEDLGYAVSLIPGTREYKVTAKTAAAKADLANLLTQMQAVPGAKNINMSAKTAGAIRDLENLKTKVAGTHGKTLTMNVPTAEGRRQLELLGFKIQSTHGKTVTVSVPSGGARASVSSIQGAINSLRGKTVTVRTNYVSTVSGPYGGNKALAKVMGKADGGTVDYYADGGVQRGGVRQFAGGAEQHVAQFAPAGTWRVWAEPETGGEAYIPLSPAKRGRSREIAEETVKRLGGKGVAWNANGSITQYAGGGMDFSYSGTGGQANRYTLSGLVSDSNDKKGNFSLSIFTSKLKASNNSLDAWRKNLATVASRAGQDVADALAEMGDDGIALTKQMATGSSKYINAMAGDLRNLAASAKASLGEYTAQMKTAVKDQTAFQSDLAKLASMGYGDLAGRLASQNDQDAAALAGQAARDKNKAAAANSAAKSANQALDGDQLAQLVQIIAAVTKSTTGIHDVAATTGLGEDEIIATATKAAAQIKSSLGSRGTRFLSDLSKAQKGLAYANGGIRPGIYGTQSGAVTFAEPSTGGEAYIPLGANKRASATNVLSDVAGRFGIGLTDANANRVVIIREQGPLVGETHFHVADHGRSQDLARDLDARNAYQLRRLARGGAAAR